MKYGNTSNQSKGRRKLVLGNTLTISLDIYCYELALCPFIISIINVFTNEMKLTQLFQ